MVTHGSLRADDELIKLRPKFSRLTNHHVHLFPSVRNVGVYLFCSKISASFHLQKAAEMREKIKILQNEIEILRSKVNAKDRYVRLNVS